MKMVGANGDDGDDDNDGSAIIGLINFSVIMNFKYG